MNLEYVEGEYVVVAEAGLALDCAGSCFPDCVYRFLKVSAEAKST